MKKVVVLIMIMMMVSVYAEVTYDETSETYTATSGGKTQTYVYDGAYTPPAELTIDNEVYNMVTNAVGPGGNPVYKHSDGEMFSAVKVGETYQAQQVVQEDGKYVANKGSAKKDTQSTVIGGNQVALMMPGTVLLSSNSNGDEMQVFNAAGVHEVIGSNGNYEECTTSTQGCNAHKDGIEGSSFMSAVDINAVQKKLGETEPQKEDNKKESTNRYTPTAPIYEAGSLGRSGTAGGTQAWGRAADALAQAGKTQWVSDLIFGDQRRETLRNRYDKWATETFDLVGTTESISAWVCKDELPDIVDPMNGGVGQIFDADGNVLTVAHITAQKHGPQPYLCDMDAEEMCPNNAECDDMVCVDTAGNPLAGYLYVIEWAVSIPASYDGNEEWVTAPWADATAVDGYIGVQVEIEGDEKRVLYDDGMGTDYPVQLSAGTKESDKIVTYSLSEYDTVRIKFAPAIKSVNLQPMWGSFEDKVAGDIVTVENSIVGIDSPATFNYRSEDELPPSTLSSEASVVTQVQI